MLAGIAVSQLKAVEHVYLSGVPGTTGQPNYAYTYTGLSLGFFVLCVKISILCSTTRGLTMPI